MSIRLEWLGHGGWLIETNQHTILLDPFLSENPVATRRVDAIPADAILISHGHFDHIADVPAIAKRTNAHVIACFEIAEWLRGKYGLSQLTGMNLGGEAAFPFGRVKMTQAWHSSQLPDGSYGGNPAGFLLTLGEQRLYFACDTALFSDMQLYARPALDVAVLPIGDLFTMGIADSIQAIQWLKPKKVLPAHYNTWPPIAQDATAWAAQVREQTTAEPIVLRPGEACAL